jgi:hypothetical protein
LVAQNAEILVLNLAVSIFTTGIQMVNTTAGRKAAALISQIHWSEYVLFKDSFHTAK